MSVVGWLLGFWCLLWVIIGAAGRRPSRGVSDVWAAGCILLLSTQMTISWGSKGFIASLFMGAVFLVSAASKYGFKRSSVPTTFTRQIESIAPKTAPAKDTDSSSSQPYSGTFIHVYIGALDDPSFSFDREDWNGNLPKRLFPKLPSLSGWNDSGILLEIISRIEAGIYAGKQVDWGGWVAKLSKAQIREFITELYADSGSEYAAELQSLHEQVGELDSEKQYALVACESPYDWAP